VALKAPLVAFGLGLRILATGPASYEATPIAAEAEADPKKMFLAAANERQVP
jgi:hypothetical protein